MYTPVNPSFPIYDEKFLNQPPISEGKTYFIIIGHLSVLWNWFEPQYEKTNNVDSDQVWHKPGCTATGDGQKLEILYLGSRGIVLSK